MSSQKPLNILVSGAGIAGGAFVSCLLRGLPTSKITVIERDPQPRLTGASVDIRSSAVDIIKWMGIEPEIRAAGTGEKGVQFVRSDGSVISTFMATGNTEVQSMTSEYEIFRGRVAEILLKPALERVSMVFNESVEHYEELDDGVVVTFKHGKQTEKYDPLVGCDGLGSRIRGQMTGEKPRSHIHGEGLHAAYFTIKKDLLNGSKIAPWFNDTRGRGIFIRPDPDPLGRTRGNLTVTTTTHELELRHRLDAAMAQGNEAMMDLLEELFADAGWRSKEVLEGMRGSDDFYASLFAQVWSPKLVSNRVALVGDAGFATPGIGTSLAIIGGYVLAGELLASQSSPPSSGREVEEALKRYETLLFPFVKSFRQNNNLPQYLNPQTWWGLSVKNALMWSVSTFRIDKMGMWLASWGGSVRGSWVCLRIRGRWRLRGRRGIFEGGVG